MIQEPRFCFQQRPRNQGPNCQVHFGVQRCTWIQVSLIHNSQQKELPSFNPGARGLQEHKCWAVVATRALRAVGGSVSTRRLPAIQKVHKKWLRKWPSSTPQCNSHRWHTQSTCLSIQSRSRIHRLKTFENFWSDLFGRLILQQEGQNNCNDPRLQRNRLCLQRK